MTPRTVAAKSYWLRMAKKYGIGNPVELAAWKIYCKSLESD